MSSAAEREAPARRGAAAASVPRRTRDPERTSAAILAAARREFADKGFGGARMDAIAARAGANKRMLYYYFGAKDDLYVAVLEDAYRGIRAAEAALHLTERDPAAAMRELCLFTWAYFQAHPEFLSLLATENMQRARFLKRSKEIVALHSPLVAVIRMLLDRGVAQGAFRRGLDPVMVYLSIAALICFYLSNRHTLSVIFARDLGTRPALAQWGAHVADVVLSWLRPQGEEGPE